MKKILLITILTLMLNSCKNTKTVIDENGDFYGTITKKDFQQEDFKYWFNDEYTHYKFDTETINKLKNHKDEFTVKAFMGTWCGDSQREIPRFYKVLEVIDYNLKNYQLIAVNHEKKAPKDLQKGLQIDYVPTFIFYKNGVEVGRIVESPIESLAKDMLTIITGEPYIPNYAAE